MPLPPAAPAERGATKPPKKETVEIVRVVGSGTFGVVYEGILEKSQRKVAVKKILQNRRFKNRELEIMKLFQRHNHPGITPLIQHSYKEQEDRLGDSDIVYLHVVMPFFPIDLSRILKEMGRSKRQLAPDTITIYMWQLSRALLFLEGLHVVHRDIKPHNILVNPQTHQVCLCDFGSAKLIANPPRPSIAYITSRAYRAPELMFDCTTYGCAVDLWAIGCVLYELFSLKQLFRGESTAETSYQIFTFIGPPSMADIKAMNPAHKEIPIAEFKKKDGTVTATLEESMPPAAVDLAIGLLRYAPATRLRPHQLLMHDFCAPIRAQGFVPPEGLDFPLFNFTGPERDAIPASSAVLLKLSKAQI